MRTSLRTLLPGLLIGLLVVVMVPGFGYAMAMKECPAGIEQNSMNGIKYMSGGIGKDERHSLMYMAKGYNLELVFAKRNRDYVSDVNVEIQGANHKILLDTQSCGPLFFTRLPKGDYRLTVSYGDHKEMRNVAVGKSRHTVNFTWS